jgi:hypothetical protein
MRLFACERAEKNCEQGDHSAADTLVRPGGFLPFDALAGARLSDKVQRSLDGSVPICPI